MLHIKFFVPYAQLSCAVKEVFVERPNQSVLNYEIIVDSYNNKIPNYSEGDIIISRGFTAITLKKMGVPSVELHTSGYDVITAVDACLKKGNYSKIAVVGAFNMIYGIEAITHIYPRVEIVSYTTEDEEKLEELVKVAVADGAQAIVGGFSSIAFAQKIFIPGQLIESGKEAINRAIEEAIRVAEITKNEKQKSSEIRNILNYSFQGIISTTKEGTISLANDYGREILDQKESDLIGENIMSFFPQLPLKNIVENGYKCLSEIYKVNHHMVMINCVPNEGKKENSGVVLTFQDVTTIQLEEENIRQKIYKKGFVSKYQFSDILSIDPVMKETIRIATRFSNSSSNLLIFGETGAGKELFAQSIHSASPRKNGPFVAINCAALPEQLLESELFGYVEGAFTGAAKGGKMGLFEIAHKGTIFLDEIGDISPTMQARLLRVLQEREIIRIGHDRVIPIDVRVISATNKELKNEVSQGRFRDDLLYRLNVLKLTVPPLRKRMEDIIYLIHYFISIERRNSSCILKELEDNGKELVMNYSWPGNIRELRNFCERICVLCEKKYATKDEISQALQLVGDDLIDKSKSELFGKGMEKQLITEALEKCNNNRKETSKYLNIDKSTLWRKMKKHQLL